MSEKEHEPQLFRIDQRDFLNCWKALTHSERIFTGAIERGEFPNGSSRAEMEGFLEEIRGTRAKIEDVLGMTRAEPVH